MYETFRQVIGLSFLAALVVLPTACGEGGFPAGSDRGEAQLGPRVVGIVSSRSAPDLVAGAHRLMDALPDARVILRTPDQLSSLEDRELEELWANSDAFLIAAVFGEEVARLSRLLGEHPPGEGAAILAVNSDRRLTRLSRLGGAYVLAHMDDGDMGALTREPEAEQAPARHLEELKAEFPEQEMWLEGRAFYQSRTPENMEGLLRWLLAAGGRDVRVPEVELSDPIRYYRPRSGVSDLHGLKLESGPVAAVLDLDTGDRPGHRNLLDRACEALEARDIQCFAVLARWGGASREAVEKLKEAAGEAELVGILDLQDFVVGGGGNREAVIRAFTELDVPIIKGIRLADRTESQWRIGHEGIPRDNVHYQVAMPELQGVSQPMVLATAAQPQIDERTGVELSLSEPVDERVEAAADRLARWKRLRTLKNREKRVAIIYYNHPPGRQNIGADKLDVPESLHEILQILDAEGYDVGDRPLTVDGLLDEIQDRGVNLPEHADALDDLAGRVPSLDADAYQAYFAGLPPSVRAELVDGPMGYLHARMIEAREAGERELAERALESGVANLRDMVQGHEHLAQDRALALLRQFEEAWLRALNGDAGVAEAETLRNALVRTGIPGLSGWGEPPGQAMTRDGNMLFPGIEYGKVFIGPQPPRGWEVDESLLHANTTFPPTHQYVGFYHWLRDHFEADVIVYLGRHSTLEFLPRRRAGLAPDDYPEILGGDVPVIYPYVVDGVGEGIQAKRRAMGVLVSHLTPPLAATELYDELLELRQLVETYEAATDPGSPTRRQAASTLVERIRALELTDDIRRELEGAHDPDPGDDPHDGGHDIPELLEEVDKDLLVHEVGHYVTRMQETHMPLGLHVFARDWDAEAVETMLTSMAGDADPEPGWREKLEGSPGSERAHLLAGLEGRFIPPGKGNDPIRTPEVLPTGRNFHALSSDLIPTRVAWSLGQELAREARRRGEASPDGSEAVVLWASDAVRDEGVMIAFGLDMLGVRPAWNSRGIIQGMERMGLGETGRERRRDVLFTTSGLFRDLYGDQLEWLDLSVRLALDGASETIYREHPELGEALAEALAPLGEALRDPGAETLRENDVAARWVEDVRAEMNEGTDGRAAGRRAILRVFGAPPGGYGAGVNRLADRSGAWKDRSELADVYVRRMGHAYGAEETGGPARRAFEARLAAVGRTYLGRSSHLYGLLDNDDGFDFQGGLSAAVENIRGAPPENRILNHADSENVSVESLERALLSELRGKNLNPQWIEPLMDHGFAGARTMSRDFIDNLLGWQVTNPEVVRSWVWDDVYDVYLRDRHGLGLPDFLAEGHNVHVKIHIQSVLLVAAGRGYWDADPDILASLSRSFAELVAEHGLPGSGHTRPDHPMLDEVAERLGDDLRDAFEAQRDRARIAVPRVETDPSVIRELLPEEAERLDREDPETGEVELGRTMQEPVGPTERRAWTSLLLILAAVTVFGGGLIIGLRGGKFRV